MKIMVVGSDKIFAIENYYVKYLRERGVEVSHFSAQTIFFNYYQKNIFNKIKFKSGLSLVYNGINAQFIEEINSFKPDVIFIFKGMEIYPQSLEWAKRKKIKLVNYNPDNPFVFSGGGSGNSNITKSISLYDLHLTYNSDVMSKIEELYKLPSKILPFGFDIANEVLSKCIKTTEVSKLCFLGNPDKYRADFINKLAKKGIEIDVYGNRWQKFVNHPNINVYTPVYGDDFWVTLYKYRIQLNLMRPHNPNTHNMRSFEIPGVGGIQLAPLTIDHQSYFEPDKEIFLYNDTDCLVQIEKLISMSPIEANQIREKARQRSILSEYTYKDRANQAYNYIKDLYE